MAGDSLADVDSDPRDVVVVQLDLARVQPSADIQAERTERLTDRARASNRASGTVEDREHAIAIESNDPAPELLELRPDECVVGSDQGPPPPVAQPLDLRRRAHEVG